MTRGSRCTRKPASSIMLKTSSSISLCATSHVANGSAERPNPATLQNWHHGGPTFQELVSIEGPPGLTDALEEDKYVSKANDEDSDEEMEQPLLAIDPMTREEDDTNILAIEKGVGGGIDHVWTSPCRMRQKLAASRSMDAQIGSRDASGLNLDSTLQSDVDASGMTMDSEASASNPFMNSTGFGSDQPKKKALKVKEKIVVHNESGRSIQSGLSRSPIRAEYFPKWMTEGR